MQGVRGNNDFNGTFDFFEWSAKYYMKPRGVMGALSKMHFKGKVIKRINVIGSARMPDGMYEKITDAGLGLDNGWWIPDNEAYYPHLDDVRVPWEVEVCEPIQFVFEDATTLEILPIDDGGARIAENSIPKGLTEGLNHSDFDSNVFFAEAIGKKIREIEFHVETTEKEYYSDYNYKSKPYPETRTKYTIEIELDYPTRIYLEQLYNGPFKIRMYGDEMRDKVRYSRVKEAERPIDQVYIANGRGEPFWIVPICLNDDQGEKLFFVDEYGMSIDDIDLYDYMGELLQKYFEPSIQDKERNDYQGERFDSYGVNLYTFDSVRKMLDDISHIIVALENDSDDPMTEKLKKQFKWWRYTDKKPDELTEAEKDEIRLKERLKAIDFYKRFSKRMEAMMKLPGRDIISFSGP